MCKLISFLITISMILRIPPIEAGTGAKTARNTSPNPLWSIRILAQCDQAKDHINTIGCLPDASETWDPYDLVDGFVDLSIYTPTGQRVRTLIALPQPMGAYTVVWDSLSDAGIPMASGIHFAVLRIGSHHRVQKICLMR